jgi:hypothetical protein
VTFDALLDEAEDLANSGRVTAAILIAGTVLEFIGTLPYLRFPNQRQVFSCTG